MRFHIPSGVDRRRFLSHTAAGATAAMFAATATKASAATSSADGNYTFCAFEKYLQDLSYDDLADTIAELGFDGIEATVRAGGHVEPERVGDDLPKMVEALRQRGLEVTLMTTDVLNPSQPLTEKVLRTGADLGIGKYRMGFYTYDLDKPILPQLDGVRAGMVELADLNKQLGMQAVYQNHSDAKYVGATIWDLHLLLADIPLSQVGVAFDIRHATIEAGLSWPVLYDVIKPHIGALFVKDFVWDGKKARHAALGEGRVDPKFFEMVQEDGFKGPISLHVEYLPDAGTQANVDALRRDLKVLRKWLS